MSEEQEAYEIREDVKTITVVEAAIRFKDGTAFHASPVLLAKMSERVKMEGNKIRLPEEMFDGVYDIRWIEV